MKRPLRKLDKLQTVYIAVWKGNNWPIIRDRVYIGFRRKQVYDEIRRTRPDAASRIKVVRYDPVS